MVKIGRVPGCKIKTGTYTGDGSASLPITGIGFTPKEVLVVWKGAALETRHPFYRNDQFAAGLSISFYTGGILNNAIISIDTDGFTIGNSDLVNTSGAVYTFVARG